MTSAPSPSLGERLRGYGFQVPDGADEGRVLEELAQRARAAEQYATHAQQYQQLVTSPQWQQYQEHVRQQQAQQAQKQEQPWHAKYWQAPEYDPAWLEQVVKDDNGNLVPRPGAPADIPHKIAVYQQYRRQQMEKFFSNPYEYMKPAVEQLAKEQAHSLIKDHLAGIQQQMAAEQFIRDNVWLQQRDPNGNPVYDPNTGRPALSQYGQTFARAVSQAEQVQSMLKDGLISPIQFHQMIAMPQVQIQMLQEQLARLQNGGSQPGAPVLQANAGQNGATRPADMAWLRAHNAPSHQAAPAVPVAPPNGTNGMSLHERLMQRAQAEGLVR